MLRHRQWLDHYCRRFGRSGVWQGGLFGLHRPYDWGGGDLMRPFCLSDCH